MDEKKPKKNTELPQPKPDIILPDNSDPADFSAQTFLHMPSPHSKVNQEVR